MDDRHHHREPRLPLLPAERQDGGPGGWPAIVVTFVRRRALFAGHAGWPSEWTSLRGQPRCARCGTTRIEVPADALERAQVIPCCAPCKRLVDKVEAEVP